MSSSKQINTNKNAIIYIRVSTSEQADNNLSLDSQLDACQEYAKRLRFNVLEVFREEGESAKTANRTEFLKAIEFCNKNKGTVSTFIVWKLDRFSRNSADHHAVKAILAGLGVTVSSVTEPIDDSVTGKLMEAILAGFAEFDNGLRAERSKGGMVRRTAQGSWQHGAPTGYDCYRDTQGRATLKQNKLAPPITRLLLAFNSGQYSQTKITQLAEDIGLRNKKGKPFGMQTIINWLRNPVYAGLVETTLTEERIEGIHDGLISVEQYMDNQEILSGKRRTDGLVKSDKSDYPLKVGGFIKCALCTNALTASAPRGNGGKYPRYSCKVCRSSVIKKPVGASRDLVHKEYLELLAKVSPSQPVLRLFETVLIKQWDKHHQNVEKLRYELEDQIRKIELLKQKTVTRFVKDELTIEEKTQLVDQLDAEVLALQLKHSELVEKEVDTKAVVKYSTSFMRNAAKLWQDAPLEQKVWFQKLIFPEGLQYEFGKGFRTAKLGVCYEVIDKFAKDNSILVGLVGIEPTTNRL